MNRFFKFKYRSAVFQALGDVVHLVEDMGQPQHTRNDCHADTRDDGNLREHKSIYETYIEARATGATFTVQDYTTTLDYQ
ncbi:MAG: hypothetical protein ACYC9K_04225 [Sulfuricaulis sp.]